MRVSKKDFFSRVLVLFFLIFICIFVIDGTFFSVSPIEIIITFVLIGIINIINIVKCSGKGPTLQLIFWIFNYLFNFIAPIVQISYGSFPFKVGIEYEKVLVSNILLILSYIIFMMVVSRKQTDQKDAKKESFIKRNLKLKSSFMIILFVISTSICIYYVSTYGLSNLLLRSTASEIYGDNQIEFLVMGTILPSIMSLSVIFAIIYYRSNKKLFRLLLIIYFLTVFMITFSPLSLPRFKMAALYGSILLFAISPLKKKNYFLYGFIFSMLFLFPTLSFLRNTNLSDMPNIFRETLNSVTDDFSGGDYDSYSTLSLTFTYVKNNGITFGKQLLGVLLFFVPRSIWPTKPVGSGAMIAESLNKNFTNVSCQFLAEGYINFGMLGFFVFIILMALMIRMCDNYFDKNISFKNNNTILSIIYYYVIFLLFYVLRGDLLSSFAYTIGIIITIIFLSLIVVFSNRKQRS